MLPHFAARLLGCVAAGLTLLPSLSPAGVRHFTFLYEAPTSAPGSWELENWVTWKRTSDPGRADQVEFRHEIEYGVTDRFQASLYFADWFYESDANHSGTTYADAAVELLYNLSNPVTDPIGLSLYQEYKAGYRLFEWESKVILQKNFGPWIFAYNLTLEAIWEGEQLAEREGELVEALGASYEISPRFSVGAELVHEIVFPEWGEEETAQNVFVGPNLSYRRGHWFVTVSALVQATDTVDEPDLQVRSIFGIGF
jgi:hypothetical protein